MKLLSERSASGSLRWRSASITTTEMDVFVLGTLCEVGKEHEAAYKLLTLALKNVFDLREIPSIERMENGKPFFLDYSGICFNLSHSHGAAVCALHDKPIGIDVEKLRPAPKRLADGMDDRSFFLLWTAKEASVKRKGRGVGALLHGYDPDPLCETFDSFLPGWIVTVCPSESADIRLVRV